MAAAENYLEALASDIGLHVPDCPRDLLRLYALLTLVAGDKVTLENVHDAWAAWSTATRPDHPALIPFDELSPEVQALDQPYADAIRAVASHIELDDTVTVSRKDLQQVLEAVYLRYTPEAREAYKRVCDVAGVRATEVGE